jgi:hypothetical protein
MIRRSRSSGYLIRRSYTKPLKSLDARRHVAYMLHRRCRAGKRIGKRRDVAPDGQRPPGERLRGGQAPRQASKSPVPAFRHQNIDALAPGAP